MPTEVDPLVYFNGFILDERHRNLAQTALRWSIECSQRPNFDEHVQRVFLAATFGYFCAPKSASWAEILISVKFLVLFWQIDEASESELVDFVAALSGMPVTSANRVAVAEFEHYHDSLLHEFWHKGSAVADFGNALRTLCLTVRQEKQSDKHALSESEMLALRKIVCGVPAFVECWRAIRGLELEPEVAGALEQHAVLDITCELASLVNDIASFDRDENAMRVDSEGADANLVILRMREFSDGEPALESVIRWYNAKVAEYHCAEQALLRGEFGGDAGLRAYLEVLHCAIVGDLATSKHLVPLRYRGSEAALARLLKLDEIA